MKKITILFMPSILYTFTACAQQAPASTEAIASATTEYVYPKPAESMRWKEERVMERREFYNARKAFDPSAEYATLYSRSASSSLDPVIDRGAVKLMDGSTHAQIAYYNNAAIGTVIKLTNPSNGKVTYAVVIGKLPPTESDSFKIKLSDRAARNIDLKDYNTVEVVCYTPPVH